MQKYVKKVTAFIGFLGICVISLQAVAQDKASRPSPPAQVSQKVGDATITINYGQPSVRGRKIWGTELVPYGQVWRAGANEATTFEVDKDIMVEGQTLPAGKYSFFTIPTEKDWTIIFNKVPNQWGAFKYDEKQDALRVKVTPKQSASFKEKLEYSISPAGNVGMSWENVAVGVNVKGK